MTRVILRGIAARRARAAMTALAIILRVGVISGALTVSDTLQHAASALTYSSYRGTDAVVVARTAFPSPASDAAAATRRFRPPC